MCVMRETGLFQFGALLIALHCTEASLKDQHDAGQQQSLE